MEKIINHHLSSKFLPARWSNWLFHRVLKRASSRYVEGTEEGGDVLRKLYPQHFYDQIRRDMAIELGGKEIAKILDAESNQQLRSIRKAVRNMYEKRDGVYAPVHDFWSLIEMVLHIKKKELPELITAQNVDWSVQTLPLSELEITWMPFIESHPELFGTKPWKIADLQRIFADSPKLLKDAKQDQIDLVGDQQHKFKQAHEPITILDKGDGYRLIDGNGRLYRAVLSKKRSIKCYVGTQKGPVPVEYWVSSGSVKQLCLEVRDLLHKDKESFDAGIKFLQVKLRNNRTALTNYELYLRKDFPEFETHLKGILPTRKVTT